MKKMKSKRRPLGRRRIIVKQQMIAANRLLYKPERFPVVNVFGEEVHLAEPMTVLDSCRELVSATGRYLKLVLTR